jgi:LCP family protein required for cell wall assembly
MSSKKEFLFGIILPGFVLGIVMLLWLYRQPLGPALDLPPAQPSPTLITYPTDSTATNAAPDLVQITSTATAAPQPLCGAQQPVMNILAVGSDARGNNYLYGLADIIRLVRVDFVNARVTILEMPRDLWVEIPGISDHYGITHGKLNQAYFYGNKGMGYYDGPGEGPGLLAETLNLNFGARPDHYLAVNMQTFTAIVDAIGGIDVYLPYDVSVRSAENPTGFHIEAGQHHLEGKDALWVARIRQYDVFGRAENQNIIMCALRKKLLSPAVVPAIPELVSVFRKYVQTDLSPEQINQLACLANQMHGNDIVFASFPTELFTRSKIYDEQLKTELFIFDADFNILREYIDRFQQGTWPDPNAIILNTPSPAATDLEFACDD